MSEILRMLWSRLYREIDGEGNIDVQGNIDVEGSIGFWRPCSSASTCL